MIAFLRRLLGLGIVPGAFLGQWIFHRRIRRFKQQQRELSVRYNIHSTTPIKSYSDLEPRIIDFAKHQTNSVIYAETSGTTGIPKRIPYTRQRLKNFKINSALAGLISFRHHQINRADLYVLASRKQDKSFTALTMHSGRARPHWLKSLVYPSAHERDPCLDPLYTQYGNIGVRLWLMVLTDPGVLYCTNPSTLAVFLREIHDSWNQHKQLLHAWANNELPSMYLRFVSRLGVTRSRSTLLKLTEQQQAPAFTDLFPAVRAYCSWDGGYVSRYIEHIQRYIPSNIPHIAMYSMSTESVQTLPVAADTIGFLPIASNVRYEFLTVDGNSDHRSLLEAWELRQGEEYIMIISNEYGLQRYQSEDVFYCKRMLYGLPDLRFRRRSGLRWSFTGEKLTAEQIMEAWQLLRMQRDLSAFEMTIIPCFPNGAVSPYYVLCLAQVGEGVAEPDTADHFDVALQNLNEEYRSKRESGRLGPITLEIKPYAEVASMLDARTQTDADIRQSVWESQFKLPPLWRKLRT